MTFSGLNRHCVAEISLSAATLKIAQQKGEIKEAKAQLAEAQKIVDDARFEDLFHLICVFKICLFYWWFPLVPLRSLPIDDMRTLIKSTQQVMSGGGSVLDQRVRTATPPSLSVVLSTLTQISEVRSDHRLMAAKTKKIQPCLLISGGS